METRERGSFIIALSHHNRQMDDPYHPFAYDLHRESVNLHRLEPPHSVSACFAPVSSYPPPIGARRAGHVSSSRLLFPTNQPAVQISSGPCLHLVQDTLVACCVCMKRQPTSAGFLFCRREGEGRKGREGKFRLGFIVAFLRARRRRRRWVLNLRIRLPVVA